MALEACQAADVVRQDPGCPTDGSCTVTRTFQIGDGCTLDFGDRDVTIGGGATLDVGGGTMRLVAGSLTVAARAAIEGRGPRAAPDDHGGMISIRTTGPVTIARSNLPGVIDVSATRNAGDIDIVAGGGVMIAGGLHADGLSSAAAGGCISVSSDADVETRAGSVVSAVGGAQSDGGDIDLSASGSLNLAERLDVRGGDGGEVNLSAGADIAVQGILGNATGDSGSGGCTDIAAGGGVQVRDALSFNGTSANDGTTGGCGGGVCIEADFGDVVIDASVSADSGVDGTAGAVSILSRGDLTVSAGATISARGNGGEGEGGCVELDSDLNLTSDGRIDASGGCSGGGIDLCAAADVTLSGPIDGSARSGGGSGGAVTGEAGSGGHGALTVADVVDVGGGPCDVDNSCGSGGCTDFTGCEVRVTTSGRLLARGSDSGGENLLRAREHLIIVGAVNATGTIVSASDGTNRFYYPSRNPPIGAALAVPSAVLVAQDTCSSSLLTDCLLPCPLCGDGIVEFPETCDDTVGAPTNCDGCTIFCRIENCVDDRRCTVDTCTVPLGCHFLPPETPCAEDTPTPSVTATGELETATPTSTVPAPTPAPPTSTPSATASTTPTASEEPTATPTNTRMSAPSETPTVVPTPAHPGDANCDGTETAADAAAVVQFMGLEMAGCGADVNGDGIVNAADVAAAIDLIFAPPR
jgi:cysteine-rich repeat protein